MKNMRQLINLMEGVMAVPGVGAQPGGAGGAEADMQTAGTAARNNAYAAYDASQGQATESVGEIGGYEAGKAAIKAKIVELRSQGKHELATHTYYREKEALDKQFPQEAAEEKAASLQAQSNAWAGNNWQKDDKSGRSAVDEAPEYPPQVDSCNQSNPANADKACAMENTEQYSSEVQQAMADMENMTKAPFYMEPEDAFDRIIKELSPEGAQEFRDVLNAAGQWEVDNMDDSLPTGDEPGGPDWPERDYNSRTAGPPEDYNAKDYGSDAMEEGLGSLGVSDNVEDQGQMVADELNNLISSGHNLNSALSTIRRELVTQHGLGEDEADMIISIAKQRMNKGAMEEAFDLQNGYDDINIASGNDYFPSGADSPVVKDTGPSGARQGDNPEQKKMQVDEVHKELVYGYRNFLKESAKK